MERKKDNRLWLKILISIILLFGILVIILTLQQQQLPTTTKQYYKPSRANVEKGRYLAIVGSCATCHSSNPIHAFSGGNAIKSPFGELYGSNLTPSADFGIGRWTEINFFRALTEGIAPPARNLYPTMPYPYFQHITRADSDALYAYFMTLPAINEAPPEDQISFPYNQRLLLKLWNLFFMRQKPLPVLSEGASESWERGKYLVNGISHCGMCHSPAGRFGQLDRDRYLEGGEFEGFFAPNITPDGLVENGWTQEDLECYLKTGKAPQATASGPMAQIIKESTSQMKPEDIIAITTFLLGEEIVIEEEDSNTPIEENQQEVKRHPLDHLRYRGMELGS